MHVGAASRDSTISRSSSPNVAASVSSRGIRPGVLDVLERPAALRAQYVRREQRDEDATPIVPRDQRARQRETRRVARRRASGRTRQADEQQRAGQNHRQEPARHPEVLGDDADLVEEEAARTREREQEDGVAPEQRAHSDDVADQRRDAAPAA